MLPAPGFHHLHLNSVDPDAAIGFYTRHFPSTSKTSWGGLPALASPNNVLVLFTRVAAPPPTSPQTAIWHFGWPGTGGVLGLTRPQIVEAKARGVQATRVGGFAYMQGPDNALVEYAGNHPAERFNHVHFFQEDPYCAQLWYQEHLNAPVYAGRTAPAQMTQATCKVARGADRTFPALEPDGMFRSPSAAVVFGDVAFLWYMRQGDRPLVSPRGHLYDHIALGVADLDAWVAKLRGEGVRFLEEPYKLGATRAVMIEGPSREALELGVARRDVVGVAWNHQ